MFFDNINIFNSMVKSKKYKCPFCIKSFCNTEYLYHHVSTVHKDELPQDKSVKQAVYDINHPIEHLCQICKVRKCVWLEKSGHYSTLCDNPQCREEARRRFRENYKKKYGKERKAEPDEIREMLKKKSTAGNYKFQDGGTVPYISSYEKDFLEFFDMNMGQASSTIQECAIVFEYEYEGKLKHYLPDFYIPHLDLIIEIKANEGVSHPKILAVDKETEQLKDLAIKKDGTHNYIKIVDKDYEPFVNLFTLLNNNYLDAKPVKEKIMVIPKYNQNVINGFELPKMEFRSSDKIMTESFIMKKLLDSVKGILSLSQVVDKDNVEKYSENDFNDSNILILKTYETDFKNEENVNRIFKEFKLYYTKKYEKYINQDFMSIRFDIGKLNNWYCLDFKYIKPSEEKSLAKLVDYILIDMNFDIYQIYDTSVGFMVLLYSEDKNVGDKFVEIDKRIHTKNQYPTVKLVQNIYQARLPGSVDAGTPVEPLKI